MSDGGWLFPPEGIDDTHEALWTCEAEQVAYQLWMSRPLDERTTVFWARLGLANGDLSQLAKLIRDGFPIDADIAADLADAIEGPNGDGFFLKLMLAKGRKSPEKKAQISDRDFRIYWRVLALRTEARANGESGVSDAILEQVVEEFGVSLTTVKNAWRRRRQF